MWCDDFYVSRKTRFWFILANNANTKCRHFQIKINCPKFMKGGLLQRCYMTFSVSLFVTSRILLFGVFKENYCNLTKNSRKFPASVTERCTLFSKRFGISAKCFESTWEKINLWKIFTTNELLHKWLLRFPVGFFFHLFTFPPICRSLFLSYTAHIFCICIHICKRYYIPVLLSWDGKRKKSKS